MILSKEVEIVLFSHNISYYERIGYKILRSINRFGKLTVPRNSIIIVKTKDLQKSSNVLVDWKCDNCGKMEKRNFNNCRSLCKSCSSKGELSNSWNGGTSSPHCIDCGIRISRFGAKRCKPCRAKIIIGPNNPNWNPNKKKYKMYWSIVRSETNKYLKILFQLWNGLDYYTKENITKLSDFNITVDHKISINYGFENNIDPKEIGKLENLCICSRVTNSSKHKLTEDQFSIRGYNG